MARPPSGAVTFLFTDVVASTDAWERSVIETAAAIETHDTILESAIGRHGGFVFARGGDSFCAAFARPSAALQAATEAQRTLARASALQVRMSIHTGEAVERADNYYGPPLNRVARLLEVSRGGQVLVSGTTSRLLPPGQFQLRDLGERRLRNVPVPIHVLQLVADGIDAGSVSFELESIRARGLPVQEVLFGRERTVDAICAALTDHGVVTLTGPGGVGKTALAREVAHRWSRDEDKASWFVDLTELNVGASDRDIAGLVYAIDDRFAVTAGHELGEGVLVLDNCEHVLGGVTAYLSALLASTAYPRVLATSRERLQIGVERVFPIDPLGIGDMGSASQLFIDRAIRSGLETSEIDTGVVAEMCGALGGMPLAIELAAARSAVLGLENLSKRLSDRLGALRGGPDSHHHSTIEETIDWSYQLLESTTRTGLRALSVLLNDFDASTAETMIGADGFNALDTLADLVKKSLVQRHGDRFSLLETIRQYANNRAIDEGELEDLIGRRSEHFNERVARLYDRAERITLSPEEREWVRANARNIEETIAIDVDHSDHGSAAKLAIVLWAARMAHSLRFVLDPAAADDWFRPLLAHLEDLEPQLQAGVLHGTGTLSTFRNEQERGLALLHDAVDVAERNHCLSRAGSITANNIGLHYVGQGDWERGIEWYQRGRAFAAAVAGTGGATITTSNIAFLKIHVFDDPYGAVEVLNEIDPPAESSRNWAWLHYWLTRAQAEAQLGLLADADERASRVLEVLRSSGIHSEEQSRALLILSAVALARGDIERAVAMTLEALDSVEATVAGFAGDDKGASLLDVIDLFSQINAPQLAARVLDAMATSTSTVARFKATRMLGTEPSSVELDQRSRFDADLLREIRDALTGALAGYEEVASRSESGRS